MPKSIRETDYCGIISGSRVAKVKACQFKVFYGKLDNAPLIEQCPINLECKVVHILDLGVIHLLSAELRRPIFLRAVSLRGNRMSTESSLLSTLWLHPGIKLLEKS